jgi:UDP-N-acetylglucosamine 2-epimerase (non-hydrolysing)
MGTRPEIIKLAPVVWAARAHPAVDAIVCHSGQHSDLAEPMLEYFDIRPDVRLELMRSHGTLPSLFAGCMERIAQVIQETGPHVLVAQGDTATAAAMSLAAFYSRLPVVHVEAGLRTGDLSSPWPEEMNRRIATLASALHCAPTEYAAGQLRREGIAEPALCVTGNPVVDSLHWALQREGLARDAMQAQRQSHRSVVLTAHRRENFGQPLENICSAVLELAQRFPDHEFHFITHPNPQAGPVVKRILEGNSRIRVVPPLGYPQFVRLMATARLIISDSGGVQEEAPTLRVPLLITRLSTERPEVVHSGQAELVGTERQLIVARATEILRAGDDPGAHPLHATGINPFGDGRAGERIVEAICQRWSAPL